MRKQIIGTLLSLVTLMGSEMVSAATLALYQFTGNALTSSDVDLNSLASDFGTSGITDNSGANSFDFTDADAIAGDYLLISLTPSTAGYGYTLDLTSLSFTAQRNKTQGNVTIEARSSLDNYASLLNFSAPLPTATSKTLGGTSFTTFTIDLSGTAYDAIGSGGITFRLYFTGDSNVSSRRTSIDNVTVDGTSNAIAATVALPGTSWLMGSGLLGLIGFGRRKK